MTDTEAMIDDGRTASRSPSDVESAHASDVLECLRGCVGLLPDAALVTDRRGRLVLANALAAEVFGYPLEDLLGCSVEVLLPAAGGDLPAGVTTSTDEAAVRGLELTGRRSNGTTFPAEISVRPIGSAAGGESLLHLSLVRDAGEYRRAADEDRLRMAALVDSTNLGVVSTTLDGSIVTWNGGAEAVLGHTAQEMVGTPITQLVTASRREDDGDLVAAMEGGDAAAPFDLAVPHRDGHDVDLSITVSPIVDRRRRTIGHSMVFQDITARKLIEAALAEAKERAERTSREFEAFSYAVAHDLRAPLRAIDGFSQALLEDYPDAIDADGQAYLAQMRASAKYMSQLIDSLLALARLTHGGVDLQPVDLSELARETIRRFRAADPERQVEVAITDGVLGRGDPTMLALVIDNLLGNAWKYTKTRADARIEFGCCTNGLDTTYFVKDNGVGFDMAYSDKLFGVFQRLHPVEMFEGTGIGLATARKVLQRHGGQIWAHGEVDRGASFLFTLRAACGGRGSCRSCVPPEVCRPPAAVPAAGPSDPLSPA